jgi:putative PEP-CTERM system histidine kinase
MFSGPVQTILSSCSAVLSAVLAAVLFLRAEQAYIRWYIIAGLAAALVHDALVLWGLPGPEGATWMGPYMAADLCGSLAWLAFSKRYARVRVEQGSRAFGWLAWLAVAVSLGIAAIPAEWLILSVSTLDYLVYRLDTLGFVLRVVTLACIILALANLEGTLVNSVHGQRWRIKFSILGVFAILAAQMFTTSLGLLYHAIDLTLNPARQIGFIIGICLLLYSTLFRGSETPVIVSKRLARTSVVLFGAGAYLLFLGALGLAMSFSGSSDNRAILLALGIVVGVFTLILLLSESFRRRCTRLLHHYFYKEKYDYRVQWLAFTTRLSNARARDDVYQAVLLGFCETFGMGGAVLYLRKNEDTSLHPVRKWEIAGDPPPIKQFGGLLGQVQSGLAAIDLRQGIEGTEDAVAQFFSKSKARFAVPLMKNDQLDGMILLTSPIDENEEYNQEDFDLMEALASQAYSALLNFRLADLLSQARDMEVVGKVSAFIVHDLKNLVYNLSLVIDNSKQYIHNPEFQRDMIKNLENTVSKMQVLITQLRQLPNRDTLQLELTDLSQLVRETTKYIPFDKLELKGGTAMSMVDPVQMQKVVLNLVLNAHEATSDDSPVVVETGVDGMSFFQVSDKGCGMSGQYIAEHLFQPFKTTKFKGMGIGLYQCKQIVEAHGGSIDVASREGEGSVFTVRLPAANSFTRRGET